MQSFGNWLDIEFTPSFRHEVMSSWGHVVKRKERLVK